MDPTQGGSSGGPAFADDPGFVVDYSGYYAGEEDRKKRYNPDPGVYAGKITDCKKAISKAGNPMYIWEAVITDKRHRGANFRLYTVASPPEKMWKLVETQQALGLGIDADGKAGPFDPEDAVGLEVGLHIDHETYQGETRPRLQGFVEHYESEDEGDFMGGDLPF